MNWMYKNELVVNPPEGAIGFVYLIVNKTNGKQYIGKKLLSFAKTTTKTVKLKNGTKKKKKIRSKVDSDWRDYYGSSVELSADIEKIGKENFTREIIHYCYSKTELSYMEAKEQFINDVLFDTEKWYNGWISVRVRRFTPGPAQ